MKTAKVFANGRSRAVRIPRDWLGGADEVELRREGNAVVIEPLRPTMGEIAQKFAKSPVVIERRKQSKTPPKALDL
ncbi:MAG: virulence-associated protein VagC [Candidatus Azotimanducaceae bacterium]|jgi:virulence-associated protein VagC